MKAERAAQAPADDDAPDLTGPDGSVGVASPIQGTIVAINVAEGDAVRQGQQVAVVEAMKMEHVIAAPHAGIVRGVTMAAGDVVREGFPIVFVKRGRRSRAARSPPPRTIDLDHIRDDLQENIDRHALTLDENRPEAVARRRKTGYQMPRENIDRLVDPGSFNEYWPLIVARQHQRNSLEELRKNTPGDGVVAGMCIDQRRPVRRDALARGAGALRLYGAGGHAGQPQPLQAGPHVRAGASLPPADDPVRRGRRRPARRRPHRPARGDRHQNLHHLLAALAASCR